MLYKIPREGWIVNVPMVFPAFFLMRFLGSLSRNEIRERNQKQHALKEQSDQLLTAPGGRDTAEPPGLEHKPGHSLPLSSRTPGLEKAGNISALL